VCLCGHVKNIKRQANKIIMLYQIIKPDFELQDHRGSLVQLVHKGYKQINILATKQGVVRGGHYHKYCKEAFYIISGSVNVILSKDNEKERRCFTEGDFFEIMPFTVHSMSFPEDCVMAVLYDHAVEDEAGEKDIFTL